MSSKFKKIILLIGDLFVLQLSLILTLIIRYPQPQLNHHWQSHWPLFLPVFIIWLLIFYINDLYNLNWRVIGQQFLKSALSANIISTFIAVIYFYFKAKPEITPKTNLVIFSLIFFFIFVIWRYLGQKIFTSLLLQDNIALIGDNNKSQKIIEELKQNPGAAYKIVWHCKNSADLEQMTKNIASKNIHSIVVSDYFGDKKQISTTLFNCLAYNVNFFDYPEFYELLSGKIPVEEIGENWFIENLREGRKKYFNFIKQSLDYIFALIALVISLPLWPIIALIIKIDSPGPIFFYQKRVGKNEKEFNIIKFRSMYQEDNDHSFTTDNDKRITRFGSFLRRTRLDEIPQLLNILTASMSFIGPRPERPEIIEKLEQEIPFYKTRLLIKPGLSGWDQVSGEYHSASIEDSLEKLQYDLYYLKHRSIYLDISITLKTISTILNRLGR